MAPGNVAKKAKRDHKVASSQVARPQQRQEPRTTSTVVDGPSQLSKPSELFEPYAVEAKFAGTWYPAKVVEAEVTNNKWKVKVHYQGWATRHDEWLWVSSDRFRGDRPQLAVEATKVVAEAAATSNAASCGKRKREDKKRPVSKDGRGTAGQARRADSAVGRGRQGEARSGASRQDGAGGPAGKRARKPPDRPGFVDPTRPGISFAMSKNISGITEDYDIVYCEKPQRSPPQPRASMSAVVCVPALKRVALPLPPFQSQHAEPPGTQLQRSQAGGQTKPKAAGSSALPAPRRSVRCGRILPTPPPLSCDVLLVKHEFGGTG